MKHSIEHYQDKIPEAERKEFILVTYAGRPWVNGWYRRQKFPKLPFKKRDDDDNNRNEWIRFTDAACYCSVGEYVLNGYRVPAGLRCGLPKDICKGTGRVQRKVWYQWDTTKNGRTNPHGSSDPLTSESPEELDVLPFICWSSHDRQWLCCDGSKFRSKEDRDEFNKKNAPGRSPPLEDWNYCYYAPNGLASYSQPWENFYMHQCRWCR